LSPSQCSLCRLVSSHGKKLCSMWSAPIAPECSNPPARSPPRSVLCPPDRPREDFVMILWSARALKSTLFLATASRRPRPPPRRPAFSPNFESATATATATATGVGACDASGASARVSCDSGFGCGFGSGFGCWTTCSSSGSDASAASYAASAAVSCPATSTPTRTNRRSMRIDSHRVSRRGSCGSCPCPGRGSRSCSCCLDACLVCALASPHPSVPVASRVPYPSASSPRVPSGT
jgi:hypothetical protein